MRFNLRHRAHPTTKSDGGITVELRVMCGDLEVGKGELDVPVLSDPGDKPGQVRVRPDMREFNARLTAWFRSAADETEKLA
jgi:hypothetical protein